MHFHNIFTAFSKMAVAKGVRLESGSAHKVDGIETLPMHSSQHRRTRWTTHTHTHTTHEYTKGMTWTHLARCSPLTVHRSVCASKNTNTLAHTHTQTHAHTLDHRPPVLRDREVARERKRERNRERERERKRESATERGRESARARKRERTRERDRSRVHPSDTALFA